MHEYRKIMPTFWSGKTGRDIRRKGTSAMIVALYLMTSPESNMIGLYYCPIEDISRHTGIDEAEVQTALHHLQTLNFADYDPGSEWVWVREMAFYQVGESLAKSGTETGEKDKHGKPKRPDMRVHAVEKLLIQAKKSVHYAPFLRRYAEAYGLKIEIREADMFDQPAMQTSHAPQGDDKPSTDATTPEQIYDAYPKKGGKAEGIKLIKSAIKVISSRLTDNDPRWLFDRVLLYAEAMASKPEQVPDCATWFEYARYDDPPETWIDAKDSDGIVVNTSRGKDDALYGLPDPPTELAADEKFMDAWRDYVQMRKEKKTRVVPSNARNMFEKFTKWGVKDATDALDLSTERGWTGVKIEWLQNDRSQGWTNKKTAEQKGEFPEQIKLTTI